MRRRRRARSGRILLAFPLNDDEVAFWEFHEANPHVYGWIDRFAHEVLASGKRKIGVEFLLARVRWYAEIEIRTRSRYKITNNHKPYYARLWLHDHPAHPKFFDIHTLFGAAAKRAWAAFQAGGDPYSPPVRPSRQPPAGLRH